MTEAIAIKKEEPKTIKDWLQSDQFKGALKSALPSHMTPDRFARVALTTLMKNPKLAQCTQASMFQVMLDCSSLGLEPDGRRAHIIPYGNAATLIIDYKGLIELAKRSGEVVMWRAELVCENDEFGWDNGVVTHKINWLKPRGKTLAVYSHVKNKAGVDEYEVLTLDDVEHARSKSKSKNNGPWVTDYNEMAKKTAIRKHSKKLTLSPEFHDALTKDFDSSNDDAIEVDINYEDLDPKSLSEKSETENPIEVVAEPVAKKEKTKEASNCPLPDFDAQAGPTRLTNEDCAELRKALIAKQVPAETFNKYIKENFGCDIMDNLLNVEFDAVMKWVESK